MMLLRMGYTETQAGRRITAMETAFEDAKVTGNGGLVGSMTNDPKDRHVLAAAVRGAAHAVITENVRHFPPVGGTVRYRRDHARRFSRPPIPSQSRSAGREAARPGNGSRDTLRGSRSQIGEMGAVAAQAAPGIRVAT